MSEQSESQFTFDPAQLANMEVDGSLSEKMPHIPEGEYSATIKSVIGRSVGLDNKPVLDVRFIINSADVIESTGMDEPTSKQTLWLDLDEAGNLKMGLSDNVNLGRLRAATGQNGPGPWNPMMLEGQAVRVLVSNRTADDGNTYDQVQRVSSP